MRKRMISLLCVLALCLTLLPSTAWAAGSAYTESTDTATNTTTYTFTTFHNVNAGNNYGAQEFRVDAGTHVVLDFTHVPQSEVTDADFTLDLMADNLTVTVKGDPAVDYGVSDITINSEPYGKKLSVTLELEDFLTDGTVTNSTNNEDHPFKVSFDGACRVNNISAQYLTLDAADDAASLSLDGCSTTFSTGALTMDGGTYQMGYHFISYPQVTIKDANITFSQGSGATFDPRYIQAEQLTIENSTIQGVANIYSVSKSGNAYQETFADSFISIKNSTITYTKDMNNSYHTGMLCNSETITIEGSTITGAASAESIACIGGMFETLTIQNSEVYIESDYTDTNNRTSPAIGPDRSSYTSYMGNLEIHNPSIVIEDSTVQAASRHSAAIGLPYLNSFDSTGNLPQLSITIQGDSDITAASVYSAAIGGSSVQAQLNDDGLVAAVIVVDNPGSIGAWETVDGGVSDILPFAAAPASSSLSTFSSGSDAGVSLTSSSGDSVQQNIVDARNLLDNCTITIVGTPTISAKSGVLAVYGGQINVTGTNLVQATMVRITGSSWSVYPMETPGNVTIGSDTIGQLGYGYASVASTGIGAQSSVAMTFGDSTLKNVEDNTFTFDTTGSGFEDFYVTPQKLPLSGTVTLKKGSDTVTTAAVDNTLTADLTNLSPIRAKDKETDGSYLHLSFQWYKNGEPISGATSTGYTLTQDDSGAIITCVVSVKDGDTMFTGSVTSSAVLVGTTSLDAPELASRTENSITLVDKGNGYQYSIDYGKNWQSSTTFENLTKGTAYTFILKDGQGNLSTAAIFYTLSDTPVGTDFSIDYVTERLTFPAGVYLYSDANCQTCLNAYINWNWIDISGYTGKTLYARYRTVDASDTQSVTKIEIPARPAVSEVTADRTENSISFTGADGVAYRLTLDDAQVGEVKTGNGGEIKFEGLQPGTEYVLQMRKEATASSFRSAQVNQTIRTKGSYAKDSTLLVKAGESSRSYDLTDLLGGLSIDTVSSDNGSFVTDATQDTTNSNSIALTFPGSQAAGEKTTITVTAKDDDDTLTLTLTVKAVEVMAENANVFWVKETAHSGYVGMDESELNSAWNQGLSDAGLSGAPVRDTFALLPQYIVGGGAANVTDAPQATYQNNDIATASSGGLLRVDVNATAAVKVTDKLDQDDSSVTFHVTGSNALYMLALMNTQNPTVDATLKKSGTVATEFQYGDTLTAEITVSTPAGTTGTPTGTVELWLGDANTGTNLGTGTLASGKATITYTLGDGITYSDSQRTLNVVYTGDTIYNSTTATKSVTLKAAPPAAPVICAEATADSVTVKWDASAANGSAITGYTLTVTQNGNAISGSPFTIGAGTNEYKVEGLQQQTTYTFTLTATNGAGSTDSAAIAATTLSASSRTILVPAGESGEQKYFVSNGTISSVEVTADAQSFIDKNNITLSGGNVTLHYNTTNIDPGTTATLKVMSNGNEMTITAKVVDVVQRNDYYFWVREPLASDDEIWNTMLQELGMSGAGKFTLQNQVITTGETLPISYTSVSVDTGLSNPSDYSFVVLGVDSNGIVYKVSSPNPSGSTFSFTSSNKYTQYLIAWQERQATTIDVTLSGGTADNTFEQGSTVTAHVTVSGTSGSGTPAGTVTVYKGAATSQNRLGSGTLTDGKADIQLYTYYLTEGAQTLTFVYGANGNYKSASTTKTITLIPAGTSLSETILLPVGSDVEWSYDLNALLNGAEIKSVTEDTDSNNILSSVTHEGSTLKLTGNATQDTQTATVTVTAAKADSSTLTLNLTVKAVTVLAEQDGVFFVQEYANPGLVGMTNEQEMLDAWNDAKDANGFQNAETQHSFAIQPRKIIGGNVTTFENAATVAWTPSDSQTPVAEGSFLVLRIGKNETAASTIQYQRVGDSLTFSADGTAALYCVVYKQATGGAVTVSAELQKNGTAASSFRYGDTLTAVVTITPETPASGLNPGGTVYLYLGDPANGGKLLASGQMSDGSGTITYTLNDESILSNAEQTLYIVYSGDNNYLGGQTTVKAYLQPALSGGGGGGSITTYSVTVAETEHGTVTVSPKNASRNTTVTVTVSPDEGYELVSLAVTDKNGNEIALTDIGGGKFTFRMPDSKVTVQAVFAEIADYATCDGGADCPLWAFTDVDVNAWYHDGVHFCLDNGLMVGTDDTTFGPDVTTSRAMIATILWRMAGSPVVNYAMAYTDVAPAAWYGEAVRWAASEGVVSGYGNGLFGPDNPITREQLVAMLWRYAQAEGYDVSVGEDTNILSYTDVADLSEYAIPAMQWAVGAGIINGTGDGSTLTPQGQATRAQAATMLMRFCELDK